MIAFYGSSAGDFGECLPQTAPDLSACLRSHMDIRLCFQNKSDVMDSQIKDHGAIS
jgi:hypothetical protein